MNYKVNDILDDYKLLSECGSGAYGTVFLAENQKNTRRVALKIVYKHGNNSERELKGLRQYQIVSANTNLLQIYQLKEYDDFFYYTMDAADNLGENGQYVPDTLSNRLQKNRLKADEIRTMVRNLQENLQELHRKGLFHRDIKPDNILFINHRATPGDIGLVTDNAMTVLAGTPGFIPPEVLAGIRSYEARDDYYALGKVIYCALTGEPVGNYPSFPADCPLADNGDLIKLYNQYCSGNLPAAGIHSRRSWQHIMPWAAISLLVIITVFLVLSHRQAAVPEIAFAPKTAAVNSAPDTLESRRQKCYQQLHDLLQEHVPGQDIILLYPELQSIYEEKIADRSKAGSPLNPDEALLAEYFENENSLLELFENIKHSINEQGNFSIEEQNQLAQRQDRRRQLENILVKNYKK